MSYKHDTRNDSAFPHPEGPTGPEGRSAYAPSFGMTIREYFAAEAMKALIQRIPIDMDFSDDCIGREAAKIADATLAALGRGVVEREEFPF